MLDFDNGHIKLMPKVDGPFFIINRYHTMQFKKNELNWLNLIYQIFK